MPPVSAAEKSMTTQLFHLRKTNDGVVSDSSVYVSVHTVCMYTDECLCELVGGYLHILFLPGTHRDV